MLRKSLAAALLVLLPAVARAQGGLMQSQPVVPGHAAAWVANGVIADANGAAGTGPLLSSLGVTSSSSCSLFANSGPTTSPYAQLCLGISTSQALLSVAGVAGAATPPFGIADPNGFVPPVWSSRPSNPTNGTLGYNTSTGAYDAYLDGAWTSLSGSSSSGNVSASTVVPLFSGAVARTLASSRADAVSVKDFGAACDGVTNDNTALTAALNSGAAVFVPRGVVCYAGTSPLTVSANTLTLFGQDEYTSQIEWGGTGGGIAFTGSSPSSPVSPDQGNAFNIHDLSLITQTNGGGTALSLTCMHNGTGHVNHVVFQGDNPTTHMWNKGLVLTGCSNDFIEDNWFWGYGSGSSTIAGSVAFEMVNYPGGSSSYVGHFEHNVTQGWDLCLHVYGQSGTGIHGIEGFHADHNSLTGCNTVALIDMTNAGYVPPGFFFSGNEMNAGAAGGGGSYSGDILDLKDVAQVFVSDNVMYQSGTGAFTVISGSNDIQFHDNFQIVVNPPAASNQYGVTFSGTNSWINVFHNICESVYGCGLMASGTSHVNWFGNLIQGTNSDLTNANTGTYIAYFLSPNTANADTTQAQTQVALDGGTTLSGPVYYATRSVASGSSDTASSTDYTIIWQTGTSGARTETLPVCTGATFGGQNIVIADGAGNAASGTITAAAQGSDVIHGTSTITTNYGSLRFQCVAGIWLNTQ